MAENVVGQMRSKGRTSTITETTSVRMNFLIHCSTTVEQASTTSRLSGHLDSGIQQLRYVHIHTPPARKYIIFMISQ